MSCWKQNKFERAVKYGSDEDIRKAARELGSSHFDREENCEFAKKVLEENKHSTRSSGDKASYDGVTIRTGPFPKIEVEEDED